MILNIFLLSILFISIIFNARIGMAPVIMSGLVLIVFSKQRFKLISASVIFIFIFTNYILITSFSVQNEESIEWGLTFFQETIDLLGGKKTYHTYSELSTSMTFFPDTLLGLFFGEGRRIFGTNIYQNSDIGYIQQIFLGGLFYLTLLLMFLWYLFKKAYKYTEDKMLLIIFILTLLVVNYKGNALFISSGFFRLFTFYYVYIMLNSKFYLNDRTRSTK